LFPLRFLTLHFYLDVKTKIQQSRNKNASLLIFNQ
jgi:hypothetical protein